MQLFNTGSTPEDFVPMVRDEEGLPAYWNLNIYLAKHIATAVEELRRGLHGYPADMTQPAWEAYLDNIIKGLREYDADKPETTQAAACAMIMIGARFGDLWD